MMIRGSWETAYGWARAAGIIGDSFLGRRRPRLTESKSIRELYRESFRREAPEIPEPALLSLAERELAQRLQERIGGVCPCKDGFLRAARRRYEFENAKTLYLSARAGRELPPLHELEYGTEIVVEAYPDVQAMFPSKRFSWIADSREGEDLAVANRLDRQFYEELWAAATALPRSDRAAARQLVLEEAVLMNCAWTIRLRMTFGMRVEEIEPLLIDLAGTQSKRAALAAALIQAQDREGWKAWRYAEIALESGQEAGPGLPWSLDPRLFEGAVLRVLRRKYRRAFHARPGRMSAFYAFTRIMEFEMDDLQSAFEGHRMALGSAEMRSFLEDRL